MSWGPGLPVARQTGCPYPSLKYLSPRTPHVSPQSLPGCNIHMMTQLQSATSIGCCNFFYLRVVRDSCPQWTHDVPISGWMRLGFAWLSLCETWHSQELDMMSTWECSPRTFWLFPLQISLVGETVPMSLGHLWGLSQSVWDGPQSRTISVPSLLWTWQSCIWNVHVVILFQTHSHIFIFTCITFSYLSDVLLCFILVPFVTYIYF